MPRIEERCVRAAPHDLDPRGRHDVADTHRVGVLGDPQQAVRGQACAFGSDQLVGRRCR
jgi:hypothetical protein